jgi:hypothetical protein
VKSIQLEHYIGPTNLGIFVDCLADAFAKSNGVVALYDEGKLIAYAVSPNLMAQMAAEAVAKELTK